jgi:lactate dehydrogenase-like 2-hydroxyacid dehydrogenase
MADPKPVALQLFPLSPYLEKGIAERCDVVRWFDLAADAQEHVLATRGAEVRAVVTAGHIGCPDPLLEKLPQLRIIATNGVGFDKVNLPLARERRVQVSTTPGALDEDVADLAVGLTIALLREIPAADRFVRDGEWLAGERRLARKVSGRRFGIVGLGRIGAAIAARLAAFGPVAYAGTQPKEVPYAFHPDPTSLAAASDVLVIACAANAATQRMIDTGVLDALGPEGYLVNISRGSVVDEPALIEALADRRIAGAALDVFEHEPQVPQALIDDPHVLLTPHIASATEETRRHMADMVLANLDAALTGGRAPNALPQGG